jgi:hypothetical protein
MRVGIIGSIQRDCLGAKKLLPFLQPTSGHLLAPFSDSGKPVDSFATLAAGGIAGTCPKRTSGLRRVAAGQLCLPGAPGMWRTRVPPESRRGSPAHAEARWIGNQTATAPFHLVGTVSAIRRRHIDLTLPVDRSAMFVSDRTAPTRRSFTVLKEPARLSPPDNGLNLRSAMGRGGTVAAIAADTVNIGANGFNRRRC